jgi:hypothetical protein
MVRQTMRSTGRATVTLAPLASTIVIVVGTCKGRFGKSVELELLVEDEDGVGVAVEVGVEAGVGETVFGGGVEDGDVAE